MTDQTEELIKEIAAKHGIALAPDDPILIVQTLNDQLLKNSAKAQQLQLNTFKEDLSRLAKQWHYDAKEKAERILNVSLAATKDAMGKIMEEGGNSTAAFVRSEVDAALDRLAAPIKEIRWTAVLTLTSALITLLGALITVWVTINHLPGNFR